jgi:glycosyltransferase involved in cell wall biosynthesis
LIYLHAPLCELFGAGTCGKYLLKEFSKTGVLYIPTADNSLSLTDPETRALAEKYLVYLDLNVDTPLVQFGGPNLEQQTKFKGNPNVGYIFSEWIPTTEQKENLKAFDVLVAGSEWNAQTIRDAGFECSSVPQGVDTEIFKPMERLAFKDKFIVYSGGKYEHRKAQDLVIRAMKVLQQRHKDILLMTSWFNIWSAEDGYTDDVRTIRLPLCAHQELAQHMNQTDVGLFPNRCEGGTNLVLMDYLACGKPAIANVSTGQADVVDESYAVCMTGNDSHLVEQMIESVEYLYQHRDRAKEMGREAEKAMQDWPWSRTADGIRKAISGRLS